MQKARCCLAVMVLGLLASACSGNLQQAGSATQGRADSRRVDWAEVTAAHTAAHVGNNSLILMR